MSSKIDMPLESLVKSGKGGGRGRGRGGRGGKGRGASGNRNTTNSAKQKGIGRGYSKKGITRGGGGSGQQASGITSRLGFTTKLKGAQNGVTTGKVQKVSDLRDVLATKNKTSVADLRAKLPPKPSTKPEKKKIPAQPKPARSPLRVSSEMFRSSRPKGGVGGGASRSKDAIFSKSFKETDRTMSRRLPTTAEAKKITVTVQGLSKTSNEAYRKEERLAAAINRQKESRQQNFMRSREEFIASSITSAISGDMRGGEIHVSRGATGGGGGGMSYHRFRSPSPQPPIYEYQQYDPPPLPPPVVIPPRHRSQGITSVTTLIISNLNDTVSHSDVQELCNAIGPVDSVTMTAPGVAEVTFRYKDDALEAYKKYNQRNLDGMPMMCRLQPGPVRVRPLQSHHPMNSYQRIPEPFMSEGMYGGHGGSYY